MLEEEQYIVSVLALPPNKQLAFALLIFERMLPSLIAFSEDARFDVSSCLQAREAAWAWLLNGAVDQGLSQACLRSAPDTDEFSRPMTSYALNAALAMSDIVEFTQDRRTDHIACVLTLVRDSLHLYLSGLEPSLVSSPEKDRRIAQHPLMKQEQRREEGDIEFLSGLPGRFDPKTIAVLRQRASDQTSMFPLIP